MQFQRAHQKLVRAEAEDRTLYERHVKVDANAAVEGRVPPAPVVCLRSATRVVIQPRAFVSLSDQVWWYRVFAAKQTSVTSKARISDYAYVGTGQQVHKSITQVVIDGLEPDEKYVIAVAAYDSRGQMVGDSIGDSTEPILASSTLSILMGWSNLCQVRHRVQRKLFIDY